MLCAIKDWSVFSDLVPFKKTGLSLAFFLSSSNKNYGKAFAIISKKNKGSIMYENLTGC